MQFSAKAVVQLGMHARGDGTRTVRVMRTMDPWAQAELAKNTAAAAQMRLLVSKGAFAWSGGRCVHSARAHSRATMRMQACMSLCTQVCVAAGAAGGGARTCEGLEDEEREDQLAEDALEQTAA